MIERKKNIACSSLRILKLKRSCTSRYHYERTNRSPVLTIRVKTTQANITCLHWFALPKDVILVLHIAQHGIPCLAVNRILKCCMVVEVAIISRVTPLKDMHLTYCHWFREGYTHPVTSLLCLTRGVMCYAIAIEHQTSLGSLKILIRSDTT